MDGLVYLAFFATLFTYNIHRLVKLKRLPVKDWGSISQWANFNTFFILMLVIIGGGGALNSLFHLTSRALISLLPVALFTILYELSYLPNLPIKKITIPAQYKSLLIAFVVSILTVVTAGLQRNFSPLSTILWLTFFQRFLFIFVLTLGFDMRDTEQDAANNMMTIPLKYGVQKTMRIALVLTLINIGISLLHYLFIHFDLEILIALSVTNVMAYFILKKSYPRRSDYYYPSALDGMMLLQYLLVAIANLFH
jgi:4-hydroxybenzoate polyprenyltransferase